MKSTELSVTDWMRIIRGEYLEVPGLSLTESQFRQLWGLDQPMSTVVVNALLEERFLRETVDGRYVRTTDGRAPVDEDLAATQGPVLRQRIG